MDGGNVNIFIISEAACFKWSVAFISGKGIISGKIVLCHKCEYSSFLENISEHIYSVLAQAQHTILFLLDSSRMVGS